MERTKKSNLRLARIEPWWSVATILCIASLTLILVGCDLFKPPKPFISESTITYAYYDNSHERIVVSGGEGWFEDSQLTIPLPYTRVLTVIGNNLSITNVVDHGADLLFYTSRPLVSGELVTIKTDPNIDIYSAPSSIFSTYTRWRYKAQEIQVDIRP